MNQRVRTLSRCPLLNVWGNRICIHALSMSIKLNLYIICGIVKDPTLIPDGHHEQ